MSHRAEARIQSLELESQRAQQERALAEARSRLLQASLLTAIASSTGLCAAP